jgi:hypothetical protein
MPISRPPSTFRLVATSWTNSIFATGNPSPTTYAPLVLSRLSYRIGWTKTGTGRISFRKAPTFYAAGRATRSPPSITSRQSLNPWFHALLHLRTLHRQRRRQPAPRRASQLRLSHRRPLLPRVLRLTPHLLCGQMASLSCHPSRPPRRTRLLLASLRP